MFLGTPRLWWIFSGLLFVLGLALFATGSGSTLGSVIAVFLIIAAMISFAAAPMRYGQARHPSSTELPESSVPAASHLPEQAPRQKPQIEAADASDDPAREKESAHSVD